MQCRSARHEARTAGCGTALPVLIVLPVFFIFVLVARTSCAEPALRLIGTVMSGEFTGAVLGDAKGEQTFYPLRATLPDGSQLVAVKSRYIVLKQSDGMVYELFMSHDKPTATQQTVPQAAAPPPPAYTPSNSPPPSGTVQKRPHQRRRSSSEEE